MGNRWGGRLVRAAVVPVLALALASCGEPPALSPAEVVSKAATATAGISSMHFVVETNKLQTYPAGLFLTSAEGDVVRPDKLQAKAKVLIGAGTQHFAAEIQAVGLGNEQFMTDPASGKWGPMPTSMNVLAAFDPNKGLSAILSHAANPAGDGTETVDGVSCYRLTTTLAPGDLHDLSSEVDTKAAPLPARLWIASSDFLLRRAELKGVLLNGDPADVVRTINFTKYNATVEISRPPVTTTATTPTP